MKFSIVLNHDINKTKGKAAYSGLNMSYRVTNEIFYHLFYTCA